MLRTSTRPLLKTCTQCATRHYSTPHPSLAILPSFLDEREQGLLLSQSLALLDSPPRTTSQGRKRRKTWLKSNPGYSVERDGFMHDSAYEFEQGHFDGVIRGYREMLVRPGHFSQVSKDQDEAWHTEFGRVLAKVYSLLPSSSPISNDSTSTATSPLDPPSHLIMHLLHLSSTGCIYPHVDNLEAFGRTIVGVSLGGGERIMKFQQVSKPSDSIDGPAEFEVLVPSGSAYIQQ